MTTTLMVFQAVVSVLLIILVLMQFGKGAEAGLLSGGASDSVFTGPQKGNIFSKMTIVLSVIFLANSVLLSKLQSDKSASSLLESTSVTSPLSSEQIPASPEAAPTDPAPNKGAQPPSKK